MNDLVVVSHVDFFSLCPHHLLVYGGQIHFAYLPDEMIVGKAFLIWMNFGELDRIGLSVK